MTAARQSERLASDLKAVIRDTEELMRVTGAEIGDRALAERKKLGEALAAARETCRKAEEQVGKALKGTDRVVRQHPYETMAITFATGFVAALLLFRK